MTQSTPEPQKDPLEGVPIAMTELIMDRFVGSDEEEEGAFNCVPMRFGPNAVLISFVLSKPVNHVTEDGITEIPKGSAITVVVQEYIIGDSTMDGERQEAVQLWNLRDIL